MRRHPAGNVYADGRDLALLYPHAGEFRDAAGGDAEIGQSSDEHFFQRADVSRHVALPLAQIENRIAHQLPGTMISNVAAAIGRVKCHAGAFQDLIAGEQVFAVPVAAQRNHVRVFDQQQLIVDRALLPLGHQTPLQLERARVVHSSQLAQATVTH